MKLMMRLQLCQLVPVHLFWNEKKLLSGIIYGIGLIMLALWVVMQFSFLVGHLLMNKPAHEMIDDICGIVLFTSYYWTYRYIPKKMPNILAILGTIVLFPIFFLAYLWLKERILAHFFGIPHGESNSIALFTSLCILLPFSLILVQSGKKYAMKWKL